MTGRAENAFPFAEEVYYGTVMSMSRRAESAEGISRIVNGLLGATGTRSLGYLGPRDTCRSMPKEGLTKLLPFRKNVTTGPLLLIQADPPIDLNISWIHPADPMRQMDPGGLLELVIQCEVTCGWQRAEELLLAAVAASDAHWAELNDERTTPQASFATSKREHVLYVPHLGMANYFGPDYVRFFGGIERFETAGFLEVRPRHKGVYVRLVHDRASQEEFLVQQRTVQEALAFSADVFDPETHGPTPDIFQWKG